MKNAAFRQQMKCIVFWITSSRKPAPLVLDIRKMLLAHRYISGNYIPEAIYMR
jgi:hypothetical protein